MASGETHEPPQIGLKPEEWVRMWETDFQEFDHGQHPYETSLEGEHTHDSCHEHTCGSEKYLKQYLPRLVRGKPPISILVSLCGNTPDVAFLARQGHTVTGVDVSEKAVKEIFDDATDGPIPYTVIIKDDFRIFSATDEKNITVYVGNFFNLFVTQIGQFDAIWDAHGIISIPIVDMQPYADKLKELLKPGGVMLFSTVYFDINELKKGPAPCPVSTTEFAKFFPRDLKIELLDDPDFDPAEYEGVTKCTNPIHLLTHNHKAAEKQ